MAQKRKKGFLTALMRPLMSKRHRLTVLSVFVICAMYGIAVFSHKVNESSKNWTRPSLVETVTSGEGGGVGTPNIGGPFRLLRAMDNGVTEIFTEKDLLGHINLIFFGFTHCPDICPLELSKYNQVMSHLSEKDQERVQVVFVGVDSARDKGQMLYDYVTSFNESFVALSGTPEQIKHVTDAYLVYNVVHAPKDGAAADDYVVDHSGYTYVMGEDGVFVKHYNTRSEVEEVLAGIKALL